MNLDIQVNSPIHHLFVSVKIGEYRFRLAGRCVFLDNIFAVHLHEIHGLDEDPFLQLFEQLEFDDMILPFSSNPLCFTERTYIYI